MALPRVLTALIFAPVVIGAVWFGTIPFFLLILGVCLFCTWEFCLIADEGGYPNQLMLSLLGTVGLLLALYFDGMPMGPLHAAPSPIFIFILWAFCSFLFEFFKRDKSYSFLRVITSLAAIMICGFFLGHLLLMRDLQLAGGDGFQPIGRAMTFFLILVIWTVDTGAWFVGKMFGKHPLAPSISPKKTWEGSLGGTVLSVLAGLMFRTIFLREELGPLEAMFYALLIALTAQISDLVESLIKRSFAVKNSSELLPGHGGLLDRFDSFIFAAPFFYYFLVGTGRFH